MKNNSKTFTGIAAALVLLSIIGVCENQAFTFACSVAEKNLKFLELVTEVKLILAGISDIHIPFISGHTTELESSLGKAQNFLLVSDSITFMQVMLLAICQSWIFKALVVVFFVLHFFRRTTGFSSKILLLLLIISPGLPLFTTGVQALTSATAIDFGASYQEKLQASVATIREEKSRLMMQHTQALDQIDSGDKKDRLFAKFREDVAYDFKSIKTDVRGDFKELRLLIHEAGYEMMSKLINFSMMVIFGFVLLPFGYGLICYVGYRSVFSRETIADLAHQAKGDMKEMDRELHSPSFAKKIATAFTKSWAAFRSEISHSKIVREIETDIQKTEKTVVAKGKEIEQAMKQDIHSEVASVGKKFEEETDQIKSGIRDTLQRVETSAEEVTAKIKTELKDISGKAEQQLITEAQAVKGKAADLEEKGLSKILMGISELGEDVAALGNKKAAEIKSDAKRTTNWVQSEYNEVTKGLDQITEKVKKEEKREINEIKSRVTETANEAAAWVQSDTSRLSNGASATTKNLKPSLERTILQGKGRVRSLLARRGR